MLYRALVFTVSLFTILACEREESLLLVEIDDPQELVIVEESTPDFLSHSLGTIAAEDTAGTAYYSDEYGWFRLENVVWDEVECEVNDNTFSFSGVGGSAPGGSAAALFSFFGRHDFTSDPFPVVITYNTLDSTGFPAFYVSGFCGTVVEAVVENVTPDRVEGQFYGNVVRRPLSGAIECTPDTEILEVNATFSLPRTITECD